MQNGTTIRNVFSLKAIRGHVLLKNQKTLHALIKKFLKPKRVENVQWIEPSDNLAYIIVFHDESTFESGESQSLLWQFEKRFVTKRWEKIF